VSIYLYHRLRESGRFSPEALLWAIARGRRERVSLTEALVVMDVSHARLLMGIVGSEGEKADTSWRPDPRLLLDLPPGICERYLAFPFRERAGAVEVATISGLDTGVQHEFEAHFKRPVALFRGNIQALLAAAGAPVDLGALTFRLSEPPPALGGEALPLVRKGAGKHRIRKRTATSPGIGTGGAINLPSQNIDTTARPPTWLSPSLRGADQLAQVRDVRELCVALSAMLPAPALIFELTQGRLLLRGSSGAGAYGEESISLLDESSLCTAVEEGNYLGLWYQCAAHERFATSFCEGTLVRVDRIGGLDSALVIVMSGDFGTQRGAEILEMATDAWRRIAERIEFLSGL